ncbi:hypothetical protein LTR86_000382 [Recurvomyces mirabilis]|nr:hypothetical protein LTR86_000382 [Recurvomyces mirabilis]
MAAVEEAQQQPTDPKEAPNTSPETEGKSSSIHTKVLRRACDCCRKRKVRCDGAEPCGPCKKATIRCAYLQPPKKKGPKGLRSAKVLHALRRIDDTANGSPTSPLSPEQNGGAFGNWGWSSATTSAGNMQAGAAYGVPTSVPPEHQYYQPDMTSIPAPMQIAPDPPQLYRSDTDSSAWQPNSQSMPTVSIPTISLKPEPSPPGALSDRLPGDQFMPYVQLFFSHMFPIMPIIDHGIYLDPRLYADMNALGPDVYCFLCALCAATVVQLDASIPQPASFHANKSADDLFVEECLRERASYDFVSESQTLSCMTSFFLFAYHGNHENNGKAWYYLQEAITFSQNLNMDDEQTYGKHDPTDAQWRRRLYWLLFVTERAYAVQRRKHTRLHASVNLPAVFESEDPHLLNGFVNLANLFSAVDDSFVSAWRGARRQSLCNEAWLASTQKQLDAAALALDNVTETQHLDISVTRAWLQVLSWQMGVSNGLIWGKGEPGMRLDYPIAMARKVCEITSGANASALDSHGIGMEQKLSDIAGCLADVLRCTADDTSATFLEGKQYLNMLLGKLSDMRGRESRYLAPLMSKCQGLIGFELSTQNLSLPTDSAASGFAPPLSCEWLSGGRKFSMADSLGMLRTLSMSGNLGMPALMVPMEDWQQRRPSGRVYDETETTAMNGWQQHVAGPAQAV